MDNDKILDYVMNSPANTNPNVLKTMLESGGSGGGSGGGSALIVEATYDSTNDCFTLQSTWQEILDAFKAGTCQVHWKDIIESVGTAENNVIISRVSSGPAPFGGEGTAYTVEFSSFTCRCASPNDYPSSCTGGGPDPDIGV